MAESVSRRQKKNDTGVRDDYRLSDLPDSLLCHILSFLPTKQSVTTSILSKRWRTLWLYTPSFDFDGGHCRNYRIREYSVQFVDTFLLSRDEPVIKRFRLNCLFDLTSNEKLSEKLNLWINAAIQRKVEHLEFERSPSTFNFTKRLYFPNTIFTCKTIVVLKLSHVNLKAISSVSLPSLKILHLRHVVFSNASCASKLLSGCMLLENLFVSFTHKHWRDIFLNSFPADFPKLISADIQEYHFLNCGVQDYSWTHLRALSKVQFLRYDVGACSSGNNVPIFHNLVHLEFHFVNNFSWQLLAEILQNSPKLQILKVFFKIKSRTTIKFVPPGFLSPLLRKCYVKGFEGNVGEMQFARYIMKNASLLRTFTISGSGSSKSNAKLQMLKKSSSFARLSATCLLCFEHGRQYLTIHDSNRTI